MKQKKFEETQGVTPASEQATPELEANPEAGTEAAGGRNWNWMHIAVPLLTLVLLAVAVFLLNRNNERPVEESTLPTTTATVETAPDPKLEQTLAQYQALADRLEHQSMVLTLYPDKAGAGDVYELELTPAESRIRVDMVGLEADLREARAEAPVNFNLETAISYISLDRVAIRKAAERFADRCNQYFIESFATRDTVDVPAGADKHGTEVLRINKGRAGRSISKEQIYVTLLFSYFTSEFTPRLEYATRQPQPISPEQIWETCYTAPKDAWLDESTYEIVPDVPGYGIERERFDAGIERLEDGKTLTMTLHEIPAEIKSSMITVPVYRDVLAEVHTPHTWIDDRTVNLMLACERIDGTILMPGEVFSFNSVVGERTAAKGYREATAYVGGASVPEIGGGVCQVASSIYYAVLKADLRTIERTAHSYLVTYVPKGMDAAIYWGELDYKFQNSSPYPIRIDASVSGGYVNITLVGTEWKNYSVSLSYDVLEERPYETVTQLVTDGSYEDGEVIVTPYTGYTVSTYKTKVDWYGNVIDSSWIATSYYNKRDEVIAVVPDEDEE